MNFHNVNFLISAVSQNQYPENNYSEIAMVGRSNVGKSSLINKTLNRKNFARVSSKPGKTTTINFYSIDENINLVDLPGYGFAKVSKTEKQKWGSMIEGYLENRRTLRLIFLLVDIRHIPSDDDMVMLKWIRAYSKDFYVIATKSDKLKKAEKEAMCKKIMEYLVVDSDRFIPFSAQTGEGKERIIKIIEGIAER